MPVGLGCGRYIRPLETGAYPRWRIAKWIAACTVWALLVVMASILIANHMLGPRPTPPKTHWSKWSTPYNTRADGWTHEHGIVQYRTNLDTGAVIERNVRENVQ